MMLRSALVIVVLIFKTVIFHPCFHSALGQKQSSLKVGFAELVNWTQAENICRSFGSTWGIASDRSRVEHENIKSFMLKHNVNTSWLGLTKNVSTSWQWINGTSYSDPSIGRDHNCAYIQVSSDGTRNANCIESTKRGYICEINGSTCPVRLSNHITTCIKHAGKIFLLGCAANDWYSARYICAQFGGQLALINKKIEAFNFLASCNDPWVGLHKEDWYRFVPGHERESIGESHWLSGNGGKTYKATRNAIIKRTYTGFYWQAVTDDEKHVVICQNYNEGTTDNTETQTRVNGFDNRNNTQSGQTCSKGSITTLAVLLVLVTLVIVATIAMIYFFKMGKIVFKWNIENNRADNAEGKRSLPNGKV